MINVWGESGNNTIYDIPAKYFTVLDDTLPRNWEDDSYDAYGKTIHIQSFPEMAHDEHFYSKLMDNDPEAVRTFRKYQSMYEASAKQLRIGNLDDNNGRQQP